MDCTIYVAKTKALISCAVTTVVFAYAKSRISYDAVHMSGKGNKSHCMSLGKRSLDCPNTNSNN